MSTNLIKKTDSNSTEFINLALNGGGILGLSLTTAFKAMNNLDKMKHIENVCGTSVGSMFGVFAACKLTNKEIDYYTDKFYDELTTLSESIIQQGYNMYEKLGLHDNKNIYKAVSELLFDKFGVHDMTLQQFYEATKIEYTAVTMCLDTRKAVYLNHKTQPDLPVGKAVQMSAAVPFFFTQVKWHNMAYVDGGAVDNMPIDYYDFENGQFNDRTLGMHFLPSTTKTKYKTNSVLSILEGIEDAQIENNEAQSFQNYDKRFIIEIDVGNIDSFNFDLTEKEKNLLLVNGYNAVVSFYAKYEKFLDDNKKQQTQRSWGDWAKSWIW